MAENPIGGSPLDPGAGPEAGRSAAAGVKINSKAAIDVAAFKQLNNEFKKLDTYVTKFQADLPKLIEGTKKWATELNKVAKNIKAATATGGPGSSSYLPEAGTTIGSNNINQITKTVNYYEAPAGGGGTGGAGQNGLRSLLGPKMQIASALGQAAFGGMMGRIDRNIPYALNADRMSMLYQQMYGMSQNQVYNQFRKPLTNYMLGPTGVNELLGLQAQTGLNAATQARSVEAMRAASGFQYQTSDILGMTRSLAAPEAGNRMFMMLGTGMYGIGGQQRTQQQVFQDIIKRTGLTNEAAVRGAFQPGSMLRARLEMSGVPADQIDLLLQYAQQNVAYKKKGGEGFYDPSNKAQRELMGVGKDQYATQAEETERTKVRREEKFYNQQADNYAAMERNTQQLERLGSMLDNWLSKLYGVGVQQKPRLGIMKRAAGLGMMIAGGAMTYFSGGTASPLAAGMMGSGAAMMIGDPVKIDGKDRGPSNAKGGVDTTGPVPQNVKKSQAALSQLNPRFAERLKKMLYANPKLYIADGLRTSQQQRDEFLRRYQPTSDKTDMFWNGTYWKHVKGAPLAPPGLSMHEIGLAVDLAPAEEFEWITANASKFGLRNFADVNNEPWHVQPNDIPGGRAEYERKGAPWGTKGEKFDPSSVINGVPAASYMGSESLPSSSAASSFMYSGMAMSDIVGMEIDLPSTMSSQSKTVKSLALSDPTSSSGGPAKSGKALKGSEVAKLLYGAGFRGNDLKTAVAIAWRESNFDPRAHNTKGRDDSYGLMQINMKDDDPSSPNMGKSRAQRFKLSSYSQLFDPATNARAAYELWSGKTSGAGNMPGAKWSPWGGKDSVSSTELKNAATYIKEAKITGDPVSTNSSRGSAVTTMNAPSYNITVSPSITVNAGAGGNVDIQKLAKDVVNLMEREIRMTMMRMS